MSCRRSRGSRVPNPNEDGGLDGLGQGAYPAQRHASVIHEDRKMNIILELREWRLVVGLIYSASLIIRALALCKR